MHASSIVIITIPPDQMVGDQTIHLDEVIHISFFDLLLHTFFKILYKLAG